MTAMSWALVTWPSAVRPVQDVYKRQELLHEELGTPMTELTKCGGESRLLAGRTKEVLS